MNSGNFSDSHERESSASLEKESLLKSEFSTISYSKEIEEIAIDFKRCKAPNATITLKSAWLIFISFSCGAAILVLPYTIVQLGLVPWIFLVFFIVFLLILCAYLNNESTIFMLQMRQSDHLVRDPYPAIAEYAGGRVIRIMTIVVMYMTNLSACISWILLAATVLRDLVPYKNFHYSNQIRLWTLIIITFLTPLMYLGTYSDLHVPALLAILSSSISAISIITNSLLARTLSSNITMHSDICQMDNVSETPTIELIFLAFGSLCFSASGASYSIPNITVLAMRPKKLPHALCGSLVFILVVYMLAGIIPYTVFGNNSLPSITTTFNCLMETHETPVLFQVLTICSQIFMTFHFMMVCLLTLNPCYLHIEDMLNVPIEMGWKRIATRTSLVLFILAVCLALPRFSPVLSIAGGVPFTLVGIIFPVVIYIATFQINIVPKIALIILVTITAVFVIGNFVSSVINVIKSKSV